MDISWHIKNDYSYLERGEEALQNKTDLIFSSLLALLLTVTETQGPNHEQVSRG